MENPTFWKLSQGGDAFTHSDMLDSIDSRLVYVHGNTGSMGGSDVSQGENFRNAEIGDYFYLTYKNRGIYLLGQFSGPANVFSKRGNGWLDRPFRYIRPAAEIRKYDGDAKWWTPNHNSTFTVVPDDELNMFQDYILTPHFDLDLADFGIDSTNAG